MKKEENINFNYINSEHPAVQSKESVVDKITSAKVMAITSGIATIGSMPLAFISDNPLAVLNVGIWGFICGLNTVDAVKGNIKKHIK